MKRMHASAHRLLDDVDQREIGAEAADRDRGVGGGQPGDQCLELVAQPRIAGLAQGDEAAAQRLDVLERLRPFLLRDHVADQGAGQPHQLAQPLVAGVVP